ncbi:MAG: hypothetical protein Q4G03_06305 [Planctomycetia bacterium]|nr:hypothetical protein [Planctomycetia bacterium]
MKKSSFSIVVALGLALCFAQGCSEPIEPPQISEEVAQQSQAEQEAKRAEEEARAQQEDEYELKRAGVGATGKGQYGVTSEEPMSIVTVPISAYFAAQERSVFDMQIPHALNLFQASEGRYPNSPEEFDQRIIRENNIVLPKLPEGDQYVYDVPSHTLMIKTKK